MFDRWQHAGAGGLMLGLLGGGCTSHLGAHGDAVAAPNGETRMQFTTDSTGEQAEVLGADQASAPAACPRVVAQGKHPQLADFETSGAAIATVEGRAGHWFYYDDGSQGRLHSELVDESSRVLHVSSSGWSGWGSGFGVSLSEASTPSRLCPYDASAYTGLSFRARGRGRVRLRLGMPANTPVTEGGECTHSGVGCYDWPGTWLQLTEDWQTHELPFCALQQPEGWSGSAPELDLTQLAGIHFLLQGKVELWIDDLKFTPTTTTEGTRPCAEKCPLQAAPPNVKFSPGETRLALSEQLTLHTFSQPTADCGPLTRRYLSYVPAALPLPSPAPVLIALHGSAANAESFQDRMTRGSLDRLAERDGFIVVYGNAAPGASSDPNLENSGSWRHAYFDDGQVDDLDYLLRILNDLKRRGVTTGGNRVYLTGLSNGGGMVLQSAKRAPERFAGIAPFMPFDGQQPTAVPNLQATGLTKVLFGYSSHDPGLPKGYDEVLRQLPTEWGRALGIPEARLASPNVRRLADVVVEGQRDAGASPAVLATRDSRVIQQDAVDPKRGAHVRVLLFENAGHFWPHPVQDTEAWILERWGLRNQDLDASEAVWKFFRD